GPSAGLWIPACAGMSGPRSVPARGGCRAMRASAPNIDANEQEQPHHVDEVPVPGGKFEAEMLLRREVPEIGAQQADHQEDRADDHMRAMESGRHEESRAVNVTFETERRVHVLVCLHASEREA